MIELLLASSKGTGIGMAIGGIVAVLVISAVFYVIGRGEDRDRAAATVGEDPAHPPAPDDATREMGGPAPPR